MHNQSQLDRPIKVFLLTDADVFAGTERHMLDLARGLTQIGVDVTVACPSPSALEDAARAENIPVFTIYQRGLADMQGANILTNMLKGGEIDIIHTHNGRSWLTAAIAVSRAGRGKCVATQHFIEPNHTTQSGLKALISKMAHHWVVRQTSEIVAISDAVKQSMLNRKEAPAAKVTVVRNGITPPVVSAEEIAKIHSEFGTGNGNPLIVCAARLETEKDIPTLISAMKLVVADHPGIVCAIAGQGSQESILKQQVHDTGLSNSVKILGFRDDAHALIAACDLFVLPSLAEPFGLVLLEAMALGKPIVATNVGGPLEIVDDGKTGMLVCPKNPVLLANAIANILENLQVSSNIGESGFHRFTELFTVKRMARDMHIVYCRAGGNRRS